MNITTQSSNKPEYHSPSPFETSSSTSNPLQSDEQVILLASARPKKRAGRGKLKETRHPIYRGVRRRNNKWVCEVRVPKKSTRIWLGTYPTPEMAARAHDVAVLTLKGNSACLNFADSRWRLPLPKTTDAEEIRRVAAKAAESFRVEEKENYEQKSVNDVTEYEVCSGNNVEVGIMEDIKKDDESFHGLCFDEGGSFSPFEDIEEWFQSMVDEPLRSPSPFDVRHGYQNEWCDWYVDAEVSLWNFAT
ncbi:hypothetical protein TanjilG_15252 [Lupinus angustifolius]|uniref:AP2/ERF domain-containing protein n=1 Tax=Lupinus angustifolius TaxID=3871 RepID=A0A1J7HB56_LUPAN|nr:PREDICTED: dehydration-responsive element-binding protein 1F-like isoform X1 [Lupinus angustifolius]OIW09844.1 hypothetical protein TanjilG_15252 [Lupinus angustifolius]